MSQFSPFKTQSSLKKDLQKSKLHMVPRLRMKGGKPRLPTHLRDRERKFYLPLNPCKL